MHGTEQMMLNYQDACIERDKLREYVAANEQLWAYRTGHKETFWAQGITAKTIRERLEKARLALDLDPHVEATVHANDISPRSPKK